MCTALEVPIVDTPIHQHFCPCCRDLYRCGCDLAEVDDLVCPDCDLVEADSLYFDPLEDLIAA